jgi:pimeloyl-ACP methyl ester carboxylesterase
MSTRNSFLSGELEISYWEWNRGTKPLLLLHGLADCGWIWSSLGNYLAAEYHIVAPDLRGHGDSSKPDNGYSSIEIIQDLEALMHHLGWQQAQPTIHNVFSV